MMEEILLKVILAMFAFASGFSVYHVYMEYRKTKKIDGYDLLPLWDKVKFHIKTFFMLFSMISVIFLMLFFIISKITITSII